MRDAVAAGSVGAWGVSAGSVEVARAAIAEGAQVISVAYNALFSSDLHDLHGDVEQSGVGVLARSILAHGLLTGYWSMHKTFAPGDHRMERWTPDDLRRRVHQATALRAGVGGTIYTMRGTAVREALCNADLASGVVGPRNVVQLDQLVREAGKGPPYLTEEKLQKLANRLEDLGVKS
jgi:aryl-alcohol dehydrogenase-like predicted oxidoreductase